VLVVEIINFWDILTESNSNEVVYQHGKLLGELITIATNNRGDLSSFDHTKFFITWNIRKKSKAHPVDACNAAIQIQQAIQNISDIQLSSAVEFRVVMGLATGHAYAGNIGTNVRRQTSVFGPASKAAESLALLNKEWGTRIIISDVTFSRIGDNFTARPIEQVMQDGEASQVYELIDKKKKTADDEWMYEMDVVSRNLTLANFIRNEQTKLMKNGTKDMRT
jgi:adenylate cyclase